MDCNCRSKELYAHESSETFNINNKLISQTRSTPIHEISLESNSQLAKLFEVSQIYLPTHIPKISIDEIYTSPLWFYKNYIAANKPCIIEGAIEGEIFDTWANPSDFKEIVKDIGDISVSVTPDGFADSIKGEYFVEPLEKKVTIGDVIDWKDNRKEENLIEENEIPYVQHQNNNLTEELGILEKHIDQDAKNFIGFHLFDGGEPDASNFWMGFENSVSSLHKDPYENFYTPIVGQKHFTLLPPASIAYLPESTYTTSKYNSKFELEIEKDTSYPTTRWISCNPDLESDYQKFEQMQNIKEYKMHVVVESGETLYLPALWYHQVSQTCHKAPYTLAVNYWFDMEFSHNYSLYETARKLKGYP